MRCPNCGFIADDDSPDCPRCGIVIEKFYARRVADAAPSSTDLPAVPPPRRKSPLTRVLAAALILFCALWLLSLLLQDRFPSPYAPLPALQQDPIQEKTDEKPFTVTSNDVTYTITPLYSYELWGLVTTYHTSGGIADMYHFKLWKDFINLKDLCVVWGPNLRTHVVNKIKWSSDTWTCFCETDDITAWNRFDQQRFSNNHLLSTNPKISDEVARVRRWDQIHLKGYLAEYSHNQDGGFHRGTSTTRTDNGQGACETIFLTDFKILKRANTTWRSLHTASNYLVLATLLALAGIGMARLLKTWKSLKPMD